MHTTKQVPVKLLVDTSITITPPRVDSPEIMIPKMTIPCSWQPTMLPQPTAIQPCKLQQAKMHSNNATVLTDNHLQQQKPTLEIMIIKYDNTLILTTKNAATANSNTTLQAPTGKDAYLTMPLCPLTITCSTRNIHSYHHVISNQSQNSGTPTPWHHATCTVATTLSQLHCTLHRNAFHSNISELAECTKLLKHSVATCQHW